MVEVPYTCLRKNYNCRTPKSDFFEFHYLCRPIFAKAPMGKPSKGNQENHHNHKNQWSMFDSLSLKLEKAFQSLKGQGRITEINVAGTIKEIRKALIDADVNYKVAKDVTDEIRTKALGQNVLTAISPGQLLVKITNDELTELMGGESVDINITGNPAVILLSGLQGSGKTTFSGKLASYLKKQGRQVMLAACDIYRPAAIQQLQVLGEQIGVEVYAEPDNKDAVKIAR